MEGLIRKRNIRKFEIDKINIDECFLPGDIVKAKIVNWFFVGVLMFLDVIRRFKKVISLNCRK